MKTLKMVHIKKKIFKKLINKLSMYIFPCLLISVYNVNVNEWFSTLTVHYNHLEKIQNIAVPTV